MVANTLNSEKLPSLKEFETILTDRYLIRRLETADYSALFKAASDPMIWAQHSEVHRYQEAVFQAYFSKIMGFVPPLIFIDRSTGLVMGSSSFYDYRPEMSRVCLGYTFLETRYWGGSTNLEIKRALIQWALTQVKTVELEISPSNLRSRRAAEKIGAILESQINKQISEGVSQMRCIYIISEPIL
jgi:RimJ/RimL family protein N-acetyltransferase